MTGNQAVVCGIIGVCACGGLVLARVLAGGRANRRRVRRVDGGLVRGLRASGVLA